MCHEEFFHGRFAARFENCHHGGGPPAGCYNAAPQTRYVPMTYDEFAAMKQEGDPRRVYGAGETPPDLAAQIDVALDQTIAEGTEPNG